MGLNYIFGFIKLPVKLKKQFGFSKKQLFFL